MKRKTLIWAGLAAAVAIAVFLSPFASSHPDGLERVAMDHGFIEQEKDWSWKTPFSGYEWSALKASPALATAASGLAGVLLTFGAAYGGSKLLAARSKHKRI